MTVKTPQDLAFSQWQAQLLALTRHRKLRDYGQGETAKQLWEKLPADSRRYWTLTASQQVQDGGRQQAGGSG